MGGPRVRPRMGRSLGRFRMGPGMGLLGRSKHLFGRSLLGWWLLGRPLLGRCLSLLCGATRRRPGVTTSLCSAGAATGRSVLLVFLRESSRLLPVCQRMSERLDEG